MVGYCDREYNGPEYTFIDPDDGRLVRKTLCEDRDCNTVLREVYEVKRLVHTDKDEALSALGRDGTEVLRGLQDALRDCGDQSRVITDLETVELAHNSLHDRTFSVLYENSEHDAAFLIYFERNRITETQTSSKTL